ncbi:ABC-F family ATP-binding cassette domain-containing protein [Vulgatibacter incomptus]|uniref:ATPase components of ABC transporter n=1 Tax=Vulgatibacter incomptus TaxID=1391653 RepID=A0A0K1PFV7_9BACT|nr:ABC-F family ATP-binding cassette domain-containing protein [Vulgatibacter incomptus]AKU92418.1 ATPase components of ABC transporter [Vulgatibacter incomptus]
MTLLRAAGIGLSFGSRTLFDDLTFTIEEGERVGLVGVNGSGKSTLMKLLAGAQPPDNGELQLQRGTRVVYLPQEPTFLEGATVASELSVARPGLREAIEAHQELSRRLAVAPAAEQEKLLARLAELADRVDRLGGWDSEHEARTLLDRLGVKDWERPISELSGGLRKRVAIARALLARPDLLLLDEPTNHLDADTVDWLEDALDQLPGSLLLVTHDRYFLDDLVDRIVEIEPGKGLTSYPGNYQAYVEQKMVALEQAELAQHKRERWIAQEVAWLRQGVEARRTKSKSRIDRAQKLMAEKGFVRPKVADLQILSAPRLGGVVIEAEHVGKRFGDRSVLKDVNFILQRGERVGIVGPNGVGKTTFLRTVLGELEPDEGTVIVGKNTRVAYYDQQRARLDPELTVYEAAWDEEWVTIGDRRQHLREYLEDLLFPVPMQRMQVKALSGGERNRLLLARLFLEGANVLVLDEPTNDLDIVTLNVLERLLLGFGGSVLLVTHDRYFLDKVATSILSFEGDGKVVRYEGSYETYRSLKAQSEAARAKAEKVSAAAPVKEAPKPEAAKPAQKRKLGYKEQRELEGMEATIEAAEERKAGLEAQLADPAVFSQASKVAALQAELDAASSEVERLYARWQELQELA